MHWLSRFSIGTRLWVGFGIPLLMFGGYALWMWFSLERVQEHTENGLASQVDMALVAKDMEREVVQIQQWLSDISATQAQDGLDDGFKEADQSRARFRQGLVQLQQFTRQDPADQQSLEALSQAFDQYYSAGVAMARAYIAGGPQQGNPLMAPFDQASQSLQTRMQPWVERATTDMRKGVADIGHETHVLQTLALFTSLAMVLVLTTLAWLITRSIVRPLQTGIQAAERVAAGDLSANLRIDGQDETAQLLSALQVMQTRLDHTISAIRHRAEEVSQASQRIAADNDALQKLMQEQSETEQSTEHSMQTMDEQVSRNADQAQQANRLSHQTTQRVQDAGNAVQGLVKTMHGIHDSSRRISDIISVIDGIAFQTNILALNAAVEAARAGEAGRGFAVVATEVRALAGRSGAAAKEIKDLITDSVQRIEAGSSQAAVAGESMQAVIGSINEVAGLIADIHTSSQVQQQGIHEVAGAVNQLGGSTRNTVQLVSEISQAVEGLNTVSRQLLEATAVFRLHQS